MQNSASTFRPTNQGQSKPSRVCFIFCLLITSLFYLTAAIKTASAATYYLDSVNGDDDNPGTSELPWKTLTKAKSSVVSGDTVFVRNGSYGGYDELYYHDESQPIRTDYISYVAEAGHNPELTYVYINNQGASLYNAYISFDGFSINPPGGQSFAVSFRKSKYGKFSNLTITKNNADRYIAGVQGNVYGFYIREFSTHVLIDGCTITPIEALTGMVDGFIAGIYVQPGSSGIAITNNEIKQFSEFGIFTPSNDVIVSNNNIHFYSGNAGLFIGGGSGILVENNQIHDTYTYKPILSETPTETIWSADGKTMTSPDATWGVDEPVNWGSEGSSYIEIWITSGTNVITGDNDNGVLSASPTEVTFKKSIKLDPDGPTPSNVEYVLVTTQHVDTLQAYGVISNMVVRGNQFYDTYGHQLMWIETSGGTNNLYENNLFLGDSSSSDKEYGSCLGMNGDGGDMVFRNNTVTGRCRLVNYVNSVFINNIISYTQISPDNTFTEFDYNIFNRPGEPSQSGDHDTFLDGTWDDPAFRAIFKDFPTDLSPASADSLAVGHGDPGNYPISDILGVSRVSPPDAGCYEYISSDSNNSAPVLAAIGNKSVNENSLLTFDVSATDADGDAISYSAQNKPSGATLDPQTGEFSWTPGYSQAGTYQVTFIASDGQAQDSETVTITVRPFSAAAIFSLTATKNTVETLFTDLDANEANNPGNYTVTTVNGAIETTSVFVDSGYNRVTVYTTGHENGVPYYLTVSNIADAAGNVMPTTTISYQYDESLVGFWHFDVNTGSTMGDSSGNGNAGTLNGAVWTKRNYGGALSFDGTDDYVDCGNGTDLNLTGSLTIAAWIRPDSFGQNGWGRIVDKSGGSGSEGYSFFANELSNNLAYVAYGATIAESNPGVVTIGKWQHVAVIYDESSGIVTFYADGEQVGSSAYSTPPVDSVVDPLVIGIRGYDGQRAFDGEIDDVRIYKRALSGEDISELSMQLCPVGDKKIKSGSMRKFKVVTLDADIPVGIESHTLPSEPDFSSNVFSWTPASTDEGTYQVTFHAQYGSLVDEEIISIAVDGDLTITKCRVKAGKTPKQDSIIIKGTYSGTLSGLAGTSSIDVSVVSATDDYQVYNEAIDFSSDDVVNGKFKYKHKVAKGRAGAITSFVLNQNKKTILLKGKNIDLTGLSCPFTLVITIGGNVISGQAAESVVNGSKRTIPLRLMRSYADTLRVNKARARAGRTDSTDSLLVKGEIAVEEVDSIDLTSEDIVLTWGSQTFTIPPGSLTLRSGKSYKFGKVTVSEGGVASGKMNLDKCTFTVRLKNASLDATSETIDFGLSFAGFDETTQVTLP